MPAPKIGIDAEYGSLFDVRHDVLVEAGVADVVRVVAAHPDVFGFAALEARHALPADEPPISVFKLSDRPWTQVLATILPRGRMRLGRLLSTELATRALHVELTDDAWGGHVLFDRGDVVEISWLCTGIDVEPVARDLGLSVAPIPEDDLYDSAQLFVSQLPDRRGDDLPGLLDLLVAWLDSGAEVLAGTASGEQTYLVGESAKAAPG